MSFPQSNVTHKTTDKFVVSYGFPFSVLESRRNGMSLISLLIV
jgi:hypothetical protein